MILEVEVDVLYGFIDLWALGNNLMHGVQFVKGFIFFCGSINAWGFDLLQFFWCMGVATQTFCNSFGLC